MDENLEIATELSARGLEPSILNRPQKTRILYVEDDADTREMVNFMLVRGGHEVITAGTCDEALRLVKVNPFDLCIIDNTLPDGTGFNLCQQLRALDYNRPILFCSGWASPKHMMLAAECGVQGYLTKPFAAEELLDEVNKVLKLNDS